MDSVLRSRIAAEIFPLAPWPCRGFPSLLSNVYIPRFLLDLSSAPLSFCEFGTLRATVREEALLSGTAPKANRLVLVCRQIRGLACKKDP